MRNLSQESSSHATSESEPLPVIAAVKKKSGKNLKKKNVPVDSPLPKIRPDNAINPIEILDSGMASLSCEFFEIKSCFFY